jgi:hypothetical protein
VGYRFEQEEMSIIEMLRSLSLCVLLGLNIVGSGETKGNANMTESSVDQIGALSGDFTPFISEHDVNTAVVRIVEIKSRVISGNGGRMEIGNISFAVVEVIHGESELVGTTIQIPFRRMADSLVRIRNRADQWNSLALVSGKVLLLAYKGRDSKVIALGAINIESPNSPLIAGLRQCYVIEQAGGDMKKKTTLLAAALRDKENLIFSYALDALGPRSVLGRERGAQLLVEALGSADIDADKKVETGTVLCDSYFLDPTRQADPTNQAIVAALTARFVNETDPAHRLNWLDDIMSCILGSFSGKPIVDDGIRKSLIRGVQTPTAHEVIRVLLSVRTHERDPKERTRIERLINLWQSETPK